MRLIRLGSTRRVVALLVIAGLVSVCAAGAGAYGAGVPKGGLWMGKTLMPWTRPAQQVDALALIAENGRAYFVLGGMMFWGQLGVAAGGISGVISSAPLQGSPPPPSSRYNGLRILRGTILQRRSIDAAWCGITFDLDLCVTRYHISLPYQPSYDANSSRARVAGNYVEAHGKLGGVLNIASNGDLFLQDPATGCVFNGRVAIIDPDFNAYGVTFSYGNCRDRTLNGAIFEGLATYRGLTRELTALGVATERSGARVANVYKFARQ